MKTELKPKHDDPRLILAFEDGTTQLWARTVGTGEVEIEMFDEKTMPEGSISICLSKQELQLLATKAR
jgi:hypothetical protein